MTRHPPVSGVSNRPPAQEITGALGFGFKARKTIRPSIRLLERQQVSPDGFHTLLKST
jgi:hypothetical protein